VSAGVRLLIAAALLVACCVAPGAAQRAPKPVVHTVVIDATSFSVASLTIRAGDTVEWVNKDVIPHTATAAQKGGFDSGVIAAGKAWRHTFDKPARLSYECIFHPTMKATLRVR
jgi:plastocyanin